MIRATNIVSSQGAEVLEDGVRYRTWCEHERVQVLLVRQDDSVIRKISLEPEGDGFFSAIDSKGKAGDLYRYQFNDSQGWPDPVARSQPFGVHGPSMIVGPSAFRWTDANWSAPPLRDLVIYELHLGTFTAEGTFRAAIEKLDYLVALGVNAIEFMPIADFPGGRNWGYDCVYLYAPARAYGTPDDLRALVDAAHARGLTVILDVVYNHLGPDGNYVGCYHRDYWNPRHQTPWGAGFNYEQPAVRKFFAENPLYWMREFHIDGFRLDATHEIKDDSPTHILAEIAQSVQAHGGFVVAEDDRNESRLIRSRERGGFGMDASWADDFHHVVRVMLTGERESYYENFEGTAAELAQTLTHGWLYRGQTQKTTAQPRGNDASDVASERFIYSISNHDQVGNRARGERLGQVISSAAYRAASALLCLAPQTPMLFMGQEWNASTPFQFFTSHNQELGRKITEGRRREFQNFAAFRDPKSLQTIPDPQDAETFARSKLRWDEVNESEHAQILRLYQDFLAFRRSHRFFRDRARENWRVMELGHGVLALVFKTANAPDCVVVTDLIGANHPPNLRAIGPEGDDWREILSSNDARYGGRGEAAFSIPITLVFERGK